MCSHLVKPSPIFVESTAHPWLLAGDGLGELYPLFWELQSPLLLLLGDGLQLGLQDGLRLQPGVQLGDKAWGGGGELDGVQLGEGVCEGEGLHLRAARHALCTLSLSSMQQAGETEDQKVEQDHPPLNGKAA